MPAGTVGTTELSPPPAPRIIFLFGIFCVVSRDGLDERHATLNRVCTHEADPIVLCPFGNLIQ